MTKIKKLTINGIRGIRSNLVLDLDGKSFLLYGDNGSGKSSITDAIEWFYFDRIKHLSSEEIGKGGIEGLRCSAIEDSKESLVDFEYTDSILNSKKSISIKRDNFVCNYGNKTRDFEDYVEQSQNENLSLRYQDLMSFILETKMNKLKAFSTIIGFSDVVDTRAILQKSINDLNKEVKTKNFEGQISSKQAYILSKLQQNIVSNEQFIQAINEQLKILKIDHQLSDYKGIESIEKILANPEANKIVELQSFFQNVSEVLTNLLNVIDEITSSYQDYFQKYVRISLDLDKLYKISLENLLSEGIKLLEKTGAENNVCPLCLQTKNREELFHDLTVRIQELAEVKKEKEEMDTIKESLSLITSEAVQQMASLLSSKKIKEKENSKLKEQITAIKNNLKKYQNQLELEVTSGKIIVSPQEIALDIQGITHLNKTCNDKVSEIQKELEGNQKLTISANILSASEVYKDLKSLIDEKNDNRGFAPMTLSAFVPRQALRP